jgi:uncharacterized membrane protein YhaH (DUF805 family)
MEEILGTTMPPETLYKIFTALIVFSTISAIPMSKGRLNRMDYLKRIIGCLIGLLIWGEVAEECMQLIKASTMLNVLLMIITGFVIGYFLSLTMRRIHDLDKSAWWTLLILIPVVGAVLWSSLFFLPGTDYRNRYEN